MSSPSGSLFVARTVCPILHSFAMLWYDVASVIEIFFKIAAIVLYFLVGTCKILWCHLVVSN